VATVERGDKVVFVPIVFEVLIDGDIIFRAHIRFVDLIRKTRNTKEEMKKKSINQKTKNDDKMKMKQTMPTG
jgi:hypothetical protein